MQYYKKFNEDLSLFRARTVRAYMIANGVSSDRMIYYGYGMEHPAESNGTEIGREKNRRVEFHVVTETE